MSLLKEEKGKQRAVGEEFSTRGREEKPYYNKSNLEDSSRIPPDSGTSVSQGSWLSSIAASASQLTQEVLGRSSASAVQTDLSSTLGNSSKGASFAGSASTDAADLPRWTGPSEQLQTGYASTSIRESSGIASLDALDIEFMNTNLMTSDFSARSFLDEAGARKKRTLPLKDLIKPLSAPEYTHYPEEGAAVCTLLSDPNFSAKTNTIDEASTGISSRDRPGQISAKWVHPLSSFAQPRSSMPQGLPDPVTGLVANLHQPDENNWLRETDESLASPGLLSWTIISERYTERVWGEYGEMTEHPPVGTQKDAFPRVEEQEQSIRACAEKGVGEGHDRADEKMSKAYDTALKRLGMMARHTVD